MKERILGYMKHVDEFLKNPPEDTNWDNVIAEHLIQVQFFQHERFVHLIVMVLVALATIMDFIAMVISFHLSFVVLAIPLMILLFPYINHYYLLENSVQNMYKQMDLMQCYRNANCLSNF